MFKCGIDKKNFIKQHSKIDYHYGKNCKNIRKKAFVRKKNFRPYIFTFLVISLCIGLLMINQYIAQNFHFQDKFASHWVAAKNWIEDGISPYDQQIKNETVKLLFESEITDPIDTTQSFLEPVFNLLIYLPFGFMQYELARSVYLLILEILVGASILISFKLAGWQIHWIDTSIIIILGLLSYPSVKIVLYGDPSIIYVFSILLACLLSINRNGTAAGFFLAFAFTGSEVSVIPAILLITWHLFLKDPSILISYLAGIGFQFLISWILFPGWFQEWFSVLLELFQEKQIIATPLTRVSGLFTGAELPISIILHALILLFILLEWFGAIGKTGRPFAWKIAMTLVLVYFLNLQSQLVYLFLLTPAILFIMRFFSERWKIFGKIISWFLIIGLNLLIYYVFRIKGSWELSEPSSILLLVPLIAFIGMNWVRWWAVQKPDPYFK